MDGMGFTITGNAGFRRKTLHLAHFQGKTLTAQVPQFITVNIHSMSSHPEGYAVFRNFLALGLLVALTASAFAQRVPYDPYAKQKEEDLVPVRPDGKLNWPAFFKSKALEDRFQ